MNLLEYVDLAMRTNAPGDKALERLSKTDKKKIIKILKNISKESEKLDKLKKAIFYGKNFVEHKPCFIKRLLGIKPVSVQMDEKLIHVLHGIFGIQTESGEMIDALLKVIEHNEPLDVVNLGEEIGDCSWYHALLYKALNLNPNDVLITNINKLRKRYPEKFTEENAIVRDLGAERKILENK